MMQSRRNVGGKFEGSLLKEGLQKTAESFEVIGKASDDAVQESTKSGIHLRTQSSLSQIIFCYEH
jgi:hypothetical protein